MQDSESFGSLVVWLLRILNAHCGIAFFTSASYSSMSSRSSPQSAYEVPRSVSEQMLALLLMLACAAADFLANALTQN